MESAAVKPPLRYLVPEDHALALERALPTHTAELEVTTTPSGQPAVGQLLLNGLPWTEVLKPPAAE